MKRIIFLLALCLLLPALALAVTEGVVEEAPSVAIELPDTGDKLFGKWEQGLADIERAARNVLEERFNCPKDMALASIQVGDRMYETQLGTGKWQDESIWSYIYVIFLFEDERLGGSMSGQVGFDFETGKLGHCSLSRWYADDEDPNAFMRDRRGYSGMNAEEERAILDDYLSNVLGFEGYEITNGQNVTMEDGSRFHATIGRQSRKVIELSYYRFGEEVVIE